MGFKIVYPNPAAPAPVVRIGVRLFETADKARLVPDGHADAAFLFCGEGDEVDRASFEAHELDGSLGALEEVAELTGAPPPEASESNDAAAPGGEAEAEAEKPKAKRRAAPRKKKG